MPPSPVFLGMDTAPASPPSPLWRLADRRSRKAGSGNIFSSVNLWQLQRLFRAAGDQDAEQRAQLVWDQKDEAELAQALIGLKARSHRRGLRTNGRDVLGSHWLRAFNHLRIEEKLPSGQGKDPAEESDSESRGSSSPEPHQHASAGTTGRGAGATVALSKSQDYTGTSSSGLRRGGENDPDRYLHRILH